MAKVFVSHRGSDLSQAERLAEEIRNAGHDVWIDAWEIETGDSIVGQINNGLADAEYVVLCLSVDGVMSEWISREWMATLASQLNGKRVKLLPARLSGGELPVILADIKCADLVSDWTKGMSDILKAIR